MGRRLDPGLVNNFPGPCRADCEREARAVLGLWVGAGGLSFGDVAGPELGRRRISEVTYV